MGVTASTSGPDPATIAVAVVVAGSAAAGAAAAAAVLAAAVAVVTVASLRTPAAAESAAGAAAAAVSATTATRDRLTGRRRDPVAPPAVPPRAAAPAAAPVRCGRAGWRRGTSPSPARCGAATHPTRARWGRYYRPVVWRGKGGQTSATTPGHDAWTRRGVRGTSVRARPPQAACRARQRAVCCAGRMSAIHQRRLPRPHHDDRWTAGRLTCARCRCCAAATTAPAGACRAATSRGSGKSEGCCPPHQRAQTCARRRSCGGGIRHPRSRRTTTRTRRTDRK